MYQLVEKPGRLRRSVVSGVVLTQLFAQFLHLSRQFQTWPLSNQVYETGDTIYIMSYKQRVLVYRRTCQCNKFMFFLFQYHV